MNQTHFFGNYELVRRLGRGGMGEVWQARHRRLKRQAAVKLIRTPALGAEESAETEALLQRFEREAQVTSNLQSPHTVDVYDFGITESGTFYYAMELLEGLDLQTLIDRYGPIPSERVVYLLLQVCESLAEAHHHGLIHRDLKPANIFLTRRALEHDVVKVLDFGLVKTSGSFDEGTQHLTLAGAIMGSPAFLSPEALRGEEIDTRADIYALGCVAYWLLTGQLVFPARTIPEMLADQLGRVPEPPSNVTELEIPRELEQLVLACLEKDRDDRPTNIAAVMSQLEDCPVKRRWDSEQAATWWRIHRPEEVGAKVAEDAGNARDADEVEYAGNAKDAKNTQNSADARETRRWSHTPTTPALQGFDWSDYRRERIAEWSHPRYRLDETFVELTLMVDQGDETSSGRWSQQTERYRDLGALLATIEDPAVVVLGPPGCGKSTLLRRLELDVSQQALRGEGDRLTFFVQMNQYRGTTPGEPPQSPEAWLHERWSARYPELPPLEEALRAGRMLLLLDALNEMPTGSAPALRTAILDWKTFLDRLVTERPGNRVVFSCRTLDYSAPLSTPTLRVPQVVIEPFPDEQVEQFLRRQSPTRGEAIWSAIHGTPQLELMRSPYFLSLLVAQVEADADMPKGRAGIFTGFVRQALRREIERDNPLFAPGPLLTERDVRRVTQWKWKDDWELPDRGALLPKLVDLAFGMQDASAVGGESQVRIDFDDALDLVGGEHGEEILRAGVALAVLDEDPAQDEILFVHQLTQEYFAARRLAERPEFECVGAPWKTIEIQPPFVEVLPSLGPGESFPPLESTGWEETVLLAGAMAEDPNGFIQGLAATQLALAGLCAAQVEVRSRLAPELLNELREELAARSRDPEADLRARIAAGLALGPLGDPRFERREGPDGDYLLPPVVEIPGGRYPLGEDQPFEYVGRVDEGHVPEHEVAIAPFRIGRFPVTNAEWALFMASGGYEDERWWTTADARRWRSGEGTADSARANARYWWELFRKDPAKVAELWNSGQLPEDDYESWKKQMDMTEAELEQDHAETYPGGRLVEPGFWRDERFNNPAQPVLGVCWFEALAYTNWLSAQTGNVWRLPTEAEWEAAARGREGRIHAWGDEFDPLRANLAPTRVRRTTPVGVFPEGDTPEGVSDLTGNVSEWTSSLYGRGMDERPEFRYPYRAEDGREDLSAGSDVRRVPRGAAWYCDRILSRSAFRTGLLPGERDFIEGGFRVVLANPNEPSPGGRRQL